MTGDTKPENGNGTRFSPPRTILDSATWTGMAEPDDVTEAELTAPLTYRITVAGDRRAARWLTIFWTVLGLIALATIVVFLDSSESRGGSADLSGQAVIGLLLGPPTVILLGYFFGISRKHCLRPGSGPWS
jgi:hypothetical protein